MSSSIPARRRPLLLTGALVILGASCSNKDTRQPPAESAASVPASTPSSAGNPGDSTANPGAASPTAADTGVPRAADTSPTTAAQPDQTGAAGTTKRTKPPVKPSIDPGRKAPTRAIKPAVAPASAESAAAPATPAPATAADSPTTQSGQSQPLKWDAASKTATFQLIAGPSGFQFNGFASGGATLTLPPNANVVMNFINKDGTPHSAEIVSGEGPLPNQAVDAAIPRAYTNQLLQGLPQEGTDVLKFSVPASGTYRIFCGVPGHGLSGMWIWMKIDPSAKGASFGPTKS